MKIIITAREALEKGVWQEVLKLFGRDEKDEIWDNEEFILTEEQARKLKLIS